MDRAAQREEEKDGTKPLSPWQITPACSVSTPVRTVVNVGSWQRPELSSLLSWRSKGWSRTEGSCHVVDPGSSDTWRCKARVGPLHRHDPAETGRGIPSRCNTASSKPVLKHGHSLENRHYPVELVSVVSPYPGPRSAV